MVNLIESSAAAEARWDAVQEWLAFNRELIESVQRQAQQIVERLEASAEDVQQANADFALEALRQHRLAALTDPYIARFIYQAMLNDAGHFSATGSSGSVAQMLNEILRDTIPFVENAYVDPVRGQEKYDDALDIALDIPEGTDTWRIEGAASLLAPIMETQLEVFPVLRTTPGYDVPSLSVYSRTRRRDGHPCVVWIEDRQYRIPEPMGGGEFPNLRTALVEAHRRVVENDLGPLRDLR